MTTSIRDVVPSLNATLSKSEVSVSLTEAGLLTRRTAEVAKLYAEHHNWTDVKERWHRDRVHERGSHDSAQKIFRTIKRRLLAGSGRLPKSAHLEGILSQCPTDSSRSQVIYFYLVEEDALFRYVLHEILRRQGIDRNQWSFSKERLATILEEFEYADGTRLTYASSTMKRWVQGFLSVLRDIRVIESPRSIDGTSPSLSLPVLEVAASYSWKLRSYDWEEVPQGWWYLFQAGSLLPVLRQRLAESPDWMLEQRRNAEVLRPVDA